ncbi:MAG: hypothetical protein ACO1SV_05930 [Fimbriimonas sp.]
MGKLTSEAVAVWNGPLRSLLLFRWALCAMLLATGALCPRLWLPVRTFPTVPALSGLPDLPVALGFALPALLVVGILAVALLPEPRLAIYATLALGGLLMLFDINRLQPWAFQAMLLLLALAPVRWRDGDSERARQAWALCGFILATTYFWSGIQKANLSFANVIFPWFLQPFGLGRLQSLWPVAPIFEATAGVLLFLPRTRLWGLIAVTGMHAFLLAALGPMGQNYNSAIWPWNVAMPPMAFALFYRKGTSIPNRVWRPALGKAVAVLAGLMPALNFAGLWDDTLSASLYSGRSHEGFLFMSEAAAQSLPEDVKPFVERRPDRTAIDFIRWSLRDLNAPPYPEPRVYRDLARKLRASNAHPEDLKLIVKKRPGLAGRSAYQPLPID